MMGKILRILYYTAVDANLSVFSKAYSEYGSDKIELKAYHRRSFLQSKNVEKFFEDLKSADVLLIQFMGNSSSMPHYERVISECPEKLKVFTFAQVPIEKLEFPSGNYFKKEVERELFDYFFFGGSKNIKEMFSYLRNILAGGSDYEKPSELPMSGVYYESSEYSNRNKSRIGIVFYRSYYINGETGFIDDIISEIEKTGNNVRAVYISTVMNEKKGTKHITETLKDYFIDTDGNENIDVLISLLMFSKGKSDERYLGALNLPVLQAILSNENYKTWEMENYGLTPTSLTTGVQFPEFEGTIITIPVATKEYFREKSTGIDIFKYVSIKDRVEKIVRMSLNYAKLKRKPNDEKRIAIIMHNYPPKNETIGCAYGLDTQKSIINILKALKDEGYVVDEIYKDSKDLMDRIFESATNHEDWNSEENVSNTILLNKEKYMEFFSDLSEKTSKRINAFWGEPIGDTMIKDKNLLIPGIINGNVFIGIQPHRNHGLDAKTAYHDPDIPVGHHYYGLYRWIRDIFMANAIIHVGKHGSLEWLPGKAVALSKDCNPDFSIADLPNFYPYIINNPGEGTQAKRRSYACIIDHLEPSMNDAELYDDFNELEKLMEEYIDNKRYSKDNENLIEKIENSLIKTGLSEDFSEVSDFETKLNKAHEYLENMKECLINNGLHILGECPEGEELVHFIQALTRLDSPIVPSIRKAVAADLGYSLDEIFEIRENGSLFEREKASKELQEIKEREVEIIREIIAGKKEFSGVLKETADAIRDILLPNLYKTENEIKNLIKGLNGGFVEPGASGAPTRGQADILPTGRNFYGINPNVIPTHSAWETGKDLGEKLIDRYLAENNEYPENIGYVLFGSPTIRTKGEDVAEILYLLGVKPVWQKGGMNVLGIEPIDIKELGRPRIDITVRMTGFFRDAFPTLTELIDDAIIKVGKLDEKDCENYIAKHIKEEIGEHLKAGLSEEEAFRLSSYRIFSAKPGAYGTGVNGLVDRKGWKDKEDLGEMYLEFGSYVYGKGSYGEKNLNLFKNRLSKINIAVKNIDTKETDVLANDDNYSYLGGMIVASKSIGNEKVEGFVGDSSNPKMVKVKSIKEETRFVVRTKLLNPKWYNSLKRHGFKGAMDISRVVDYTFGWDATTDVIDDLTYEKIVEKFIKDEDFSTWMKNANPWAMQNILERMLEAINRGMWNASDDMRKYLENKYLENEGNLESM